MTIDSEMTLEVGRFYRAKKPGNIMGLVNDRQILHVGFLDVQYDGPAVGNGRHYPKVSKEKFFAWASHDVTDELPPGEWQSWGDYKNPPTTDHDGPSPT